MMGWHSGRVQKVDSSSTSRASWTISNGVVMGSIQLNRYRPLGTTPIQVLLLPYIPTIKEITRVGHHSLVPDDITIGT